MINWQSILSSFDDKPTLLEWLKKVQKALNESALTTVTVTQEKAGRVNSITLTFNFQDGTKIVAPAFTVQDGLGITDLVTTDLTSSNLIVNYDTTDGIGIHSTMRQDYDGTNHASMMVMHIPIVAGNNILIDKKADENKIEVKLDQSKDIKIKGGSTNSVYFTSDSSATFGVSEGSIYSSFGDESGIPRIRQKDPGGNRIYTFPTNAYGEHTVLTSKNVKTLFGNKSIVGTGNIDLYRHNICFTSTDQDKLVKIRFIVLSSNNINVNSLTTLKTLLGNTFTYPVNGGTGDNKSVYEITETGYKAGATPYVVYDTLKPYPAGTWTDDVQTI